MLQWTTVGKRSWTKSPPYFNMRSASLAKKPKKRKPTKSSAPAPAVPDAKDVFFYAACFEYSALMLSKAHQERITKAIVGATIRLPTVVPGIVNSSFSLELYLKSLLILEGKNSWGHGLLSLYNEVDTTNQRRIEKLYQEELAKFPINFPPTVKSANTIKLDIISVLERIKDAFSCFRYVFEGNTNSYIGAQHVRDAVRRVIEEIKPEWRELRTSLDEPPTYLPR